MTTSASSRSHRCAMCCATRCDRPSGSSRRASTSRCLSWWSCSRLRECRVDGSAGLRLNVQGTHVTLLVYSATGVLLRFAGWASRSSGASDHQEGKSSAASRMRSCLLDWPCGRHICSFISSTGWPTLAPAIHQAGQTLAGTSGPARGEWSCPCCRPTPCCRYSFCCWMRGCY